MIFRHFSNDSLSIKKSQESIYGIIIYAILFGKLFFYEFFNKLFLLKISLSPAKRYLFFKFF